MAPFQVAILSVALAISACVDPSASERALRFEDPQAQTFLTNQLARANISFRVTDDGSVWYSVRDREAVGRAEALTKETYYPPYDVAFSNPETAKALAAEMEARGIKHRLLMRSGQAYIGWAEAENEAASTVVLNFEARIRGRPTPSAKAAQSAPSATPSN